jgi:uracil-DNA glycosylase family 4
MEKAPLANCDQCPLVFSQIVPGYGPETARIVLVGEAPGAQEVQHGRPFVGSSGQLLHRVLDGYKVPDSELYVTNACLCHPAGNKLPAEAVGCCQERLIAEIKLRNPEIVVLMGNSAVRSVLGDVGGIMSVRGRVYKTASLGNVPIFATLHPAAILRKPDMFTDFALDMQRALHPDLLDLPTHPGPRKVRVFIDEMETLNFLFGTIQQQFDLAPTWITYDIETSGFDRKGDKIICMQVSLKSEESFVISKYALEYPSVLAALKFVMEHPNGKWVGHNITFDYSFTLAQFGFAPHFTWDTILGHYLLDERQGTHDLKKLSASLFNAPPWEDDLKNYLPHPKKDSYALLPDQKLWEYAAFDSDYTFRLLEWELAEFEHEPELMRMMVEVLMPAAHAIAEIELYGVSIDLALRDNLEDELGGEIFDLEEDLMKLTGNRNFNPASPAQVAHELFDVRKYPVVSRGKTGQPSANAKTFETLAREYGSDEFISTMLSYRKVSKLQSTYVKGIAAQIGVDWRLHTSFKLFGTVTGRLSSSRP